MKYHPSYGYATEDQIKLLQELKHVPDYDKIWKDIEKQSLEAKKKRKK